MTSNSPSSSPHSTLLPTLPVNSSASLVEGHERPTLTQSHNLSKKHPGNWLPHHEAIENWLGRFHAKVHSREKKLPLAPVMIKFQKLLENNPVIRMYFVSMISQVPKTKPYRTRHLTSVDQLITLMNEVLITAPDYDDTSLVGAPLNAVLDYVMDTPAGFAAFRDKEVNSIFKEILNCWCEYLNSPDSLYVLNTGKHGWRSTAAANAICINSCHHDPQHEYWGFKSWNDFFTRKFKPGERPVSSPNNHKIIVSACESTPYAISSNVKKQDTFWIKSQPYSLQDMLDNDELVPKFVGGVIYQAFLSAVNYHRWHSPISGTVVKTKLIEGTYYSEAEAQGYDPAGPNNSQGYITHVAARALIFLDCDDPSIGLIAILFIGMAEISSCVFSSNIKEGAHVKKGDELGYFQYGGSTHCIFFRPNVIGYFHLNALPQPSNTSHESAPAVLLSSPIAIAN